MITEQEFNDIPNGQIFAMGILPNSPDGIFITRTGGNIKWIAKKGYGDDWAIYCHWSFTSDEFIERNGDKVTTELYIKRCVECDDTVFKKYRY